jgi:hypothetical protein
MVQSCDVYKVKKKKKAVCESSAGGMCVHGSRHKRGKEFKKRRPMETDGRTDERTNGGAGACVYTQTTHSRAVQG